MKHVLGQGDKCFGRAEARGSPARCRSLQRVRSDLLPRLALKQLQAAVLLTLTPAGAGAACPLASCKRKTAWQVVVVVVVVVVVSQGPLYGRCSAVGIRRKQ